MATLLEIAELPDNPLWGQLVNRVRAACVKKAAAIISSASPGEGAKDWAKTCLASPTSVSNQIVVAVIGIVDNQFENVPAATILSADEPDLLTYVYLAVDKLYGV